MTNWPISSDEDGLGRIGVHLVGTKVLRLLGWVFRETSSSDLGIDGEIEIREHDKTSHGRLVSVQIKCGSSFFRERTSTGYVYRGDTRHLQYWAGHTTPVVIILCERETENCWWQSVDLQLVSFHKKGWSIEIPFKNRLDATAAEALKTVANRLQKKDLVELLLRDWLGWSFEHRIRFASKLVTPRDYHWFSMLAAIEDHFLMIDYIMSDIEGFSSEKIQEMLHWAEYNHRQYGYERFLLAFISEVPKFLQHIPEPISIPNITIEYVPLLLDLRGQPRLSEVGIDGRLIAFYDQGDILDDGVRSVERAIRHSSS